MKIRDWKRVTARSLLLLVLLQYLGASVQTVNAAQKKEIRGTISVAANISQQDMQQYLDGFNKKYPGIKIKYVVLCQDLVQVKMRNFSPF